MSTYMYMHSILNTAQAVAQHDLINLIPNSFQEEQKASPEILMNCDKTDVGVMNLTWQSAPLRALMDSEYARIG